MDEEDVEGGIPKAFGNSHVDNRRNSVQKVRRRAYLAIGHTRCSTTATTTDYHHTTHSCVCGSQQRQQLNYHLVIGNQGFLWRRLLQRCCQ